MSCFEIFSIIIEAVIGGGLIWIGFNSNKIIKNQLRASSRESYLSVYDMLTEALGIVLVKAKVNDEARELFWRARDRARLELPEEIEAYCQGIWDKMWEAYKIYYNDLIGEYKLEIGEERNKISARHSEILSELSKEKPYKIFSKYMKVEK